MLALRERCAGGAVLKLVCVGVSAVAVDRCGRRPLLLAGALGTTAGLALGCYACFVNSATLVMCGLSLFIGAYGCSLAPIFYTLLSELFCAATRPLAAGIATALTFAAGAAADSCFLSMRDAIGYRGSFGVYATVCAVRAHARRAVWTRRRPRLTFRW